MAFTSTEFRRAMAHFATGITVVTTSFENRFYGLTVNAFCSISLNPSLILISLDKTTSTYPVLSRSRIFGVNILTAQQQYLSERFARKDTGEGKNFADIKLYSGETGVPLFEEALACLECRVTAEYEGGDHMLILGQVIDLICDDRAVADGNEAQPLVYFRSHYSALQQEQCLSRSD